MPINNQEFLDRAEDVADKVFRHMKHILPHLARFCLVSTFFEDGCRMWLQWHEQRDYMAHTWNVGTFIATMFVLVNLVGQLGGCVMVLLRKHVEISVGVLFFIISLQAFAYSIIWDFKFLLRSLALTGGLVLLLADCRQEARSLLAGIPTLDDNNPKKYLQLAGRLLLLLMFLTLIKFRASVFIIIQDVLGSVLIVAVTLGYKTKLSALVMVILLTIINVSSNAFWTFPAFMPAHDFLKYDFFQTMSVIGGLLLVVALGPGGVSLDDYKKRW